MKEVLSTFKKACSLSTSLYKMGLSSLFLRTILFSCVALGCFNPVVVVGNERSALDIQEVDEDTRAGSGNGTDTDDEDAVTENGMDESDDGLSADDFDEAVLVNDSNETVNVMELIL